jgi:hypothetical protein
MAQSEESQIAMFGCNIEEEKAYIMSTVSYTFGGASMAITSLLSDAQHLLECGRNDEARKYMNVVKYLVNDKEFMAGKGIEE